MRKEVLALEKREVNTVKMVVVSKRGVLSELQRRVKVRSPRVKLSSNKASQCSVTRVRCVVQTGALLSFIWFLKLASKKHKVLVKKEERRRTYDDSQSQPQPLIMVWTNYEWTKREHSTTKTKTTTKRVSPIRQQQQTKHRKTGSQRVREQASTSL